MDDTIEGVDYIFDRYAFLGLQRDASLAEIKTQIRLQRAENHPDKLSRVSEDIKNLAKRQTEFIDQCERVLLNEDVKPLYDLKLQEFTEKEPHLVSTNGTPLIELGRFKVNLDYLLNQPVSDLADLESKAIQMTGYNPKRLAKARTRYLETPELEEREELRQELTSKLVYLSVIEDFCWQKAGVNGGVVKNEHFRAQSTDDILKSFEDKVAKIAHHATSAVADRNGAALLGFTKPLLLGYNSNTPEAHTEEHQALIETVIKEFTIRSEQLKALILEKKQTIDELATVSRLKQLKKIDSPIYDFFLIMSESTDEIDDTWPGDTFRLLGLNFRLDTSDNNINTFDFGKDTFDPEDLAGSEHNIYVLEPNSEISAPLLEIMALANRISNEKES